MKEKKRNNRKGKTLPKKESKNSQRKNKRTRGAEVLFDSCQELDSHHIVANHFNFKKSYRLSGPSPMRPNEL